MTLDDTLQKLDVSVEDCIQTGGVMIESFALYPFDFYCSAILNRSVNILRGYATLIRDMNFIAAAPLVRIHLDSLLKVYASTLLDYNVDEFARRVLQGESIKNLEDSKGRKMTDYYLSTQLSSVQGFEWVRKLYEIGSGHVHFSYL